MWEIGIGVNMQHNIVTINEANYHMFDDMVFWRENRFERNEQEKAENKVNQHIPKELDQDHLYVYAVQIDNKFVAWISLIYLPKVGRASINGFVYVDELWVHDDYRRLGYAKELMKKADQLSESLNTVGIRLGVNVNNPSAMKLYEGCGYASTGQAYTMEKRK